MHIVALAEAERVRIHVLPCRSGLPLRCWRACSRLMWFDDQPPVAYSEGVRIGKLHDSPPWFKSSRAATLSH